ncbi:MAG: fumarate hydratase [Desulfobacterota bacterium]|nr:fumarate hydratase [Thermodesulfobacteriota bacterium]
MKTIDCSVITEQVARLCIEANIHLGDDVCAALKYARDRETSVQGREMLRLLLDNAAVAREESLPLCQDTGFAVVFVELGNEVWITGGSLIEAINRGVRQGYTEGYLRCSICDPLTRKNTGDNTPAVVHIELVPGDTLKITVAPKGGGSENMSRIAMLNPSQGRQGIEDFVVASVREAGANPCPPVIVGVGIGGTFEEAALLAKKALLRPVGTANSDPELACMEHELFAAINRLGIGPQGLGGDTTCLAVHILKHPCHIASLPVAVNINCHAHRHKEIIL